MKRSKTKSFILTYETGLTKKERDICEKKLRIGKTMYNAFLNESLKRYKALYKDEGYIELLKQYQEPKNRRFAINNKIDSLKKKNEKEGIKELKEELKEVEDIIESISVKMTFIKNKYNWGSEYCLSDMRKIQSNHFKGALGADVATVLSRRAYRAVEKMEKNSETTKVEYIKNNDDFSIAGINNKNGIIYRNGLIYFDLRKNVFVNIKPTRKNDSGYYQEAMSNRLKYCRLLSKTIRGKKRYFIQLVMEGTPPNHREYGEGTINLLDVKISKIEIQKDGEKPQTIELAPNCKNPEKKIAELDRKIMNSKKYMNPNNFDENGLIIKGTKKWNYSKNYFKYIKRRKELFRVMAERRKVSHEELTNKLLSEGAEINIKQLSYKKYQMGFEVIDNTTNEKNYIKQGKNISNRAPAKFISILERKLAYIDKELHY